MDPVSAIGIAAAALQFLQFSLSTLELCSQIRDDATSATKYNKELEGATRSARKFRQDLACPSVPGSNRKIIDIAKACISEADELTDLLAYVRGAEEKLHGSRIGTAKALFRALKEKKGIEKLRTKLVNRERQLTDMLVRENYVSVELLRSEVEDSASKMALLVRKLEELQVSTRVGSHTVSTAFSSTESRLQKRVGKSEHHIHAHIASFELRSRAMHDKQAQRQVHQQFLASLAFPEMNQRRDSIKEAQPGTLDWIYNMDLDENKSRWANFGTWLRRDTSVYWICGKAASGKSTLMAHIIDDVRTREGLQLWSKGRPLCTPSVFFWRPGSELQNSVIGLLRSLLHQIVTAFPNTIDVVQRQRAETWQAVNQSWTEKQLISAIQIAITSSDAVRFCVFIDGLDEFSGQYDDLVNLIFKLQQFKNVKFCVASRPETDLRLRLKMCKQLRMQDLNRSDIWRYVAAKLKSEDVPHGRYQSADKARYDLIRRVVEGADGIFLWAVLVSQSLVKGIRSADHLEMLYQRLDETPKEMNALFAHMIANVDKVHKPALALVLHAIRMNRKASTQCPSIINICSLTAAQMDGDMISYQDFSSACELTETRILAQSAGLLELGSSLAGGPDTRNSDYDRSWLDPPSHFLVPALLQSEPALGTALKREACRPPVPSLEVLQYELRDPQWVHKSAYDFCFGIDGHSSLPEFLDVHESETVQRLCGGILRYIAIAPSAHIGGNMLAASDQMSMTYWRIKQVMLFYDEICQRYPAIASSMIDQLSLLVRDMDPAELLGSHWKYLSDAEHVDFHSDMAFLECCIVHGHWTRVLPWVRQLSAETTRFSTLMSLLHCFLRSTQPFQFRTYPVEVIETIASLVSTIHGRLTLANAAERVPRRKRKVISGGPDYTNIQYFGVSCVPPEDTLGSAEGHIVPVNLILLDQIVYLWIGLSSHARKFCQNVTRKSLGRDTDFSEDARDCMVNGWRAVGRSLQQVFRWFEMRLELKCSTARPFRRLSLQANVDVCIDFEISQGEPRGWGALFLVCLSRGAKYGERYVEAERAFEFELSTSTVCAFQSTFKRQQIDTGWGLCPTMVLEGSNKQVEELYELVVEDLWENAPGLDATQQLLALACVRTELKGWFEAPEAAKNSTPEDSEL